LELWFMGRLVLWLRFGMGLGLGISLDEG